MIDIKELRRLVESPVLQQVEWVSREWALEHFGSSCEAEFVSTFNPSAILSLLDKIDAQQAEIDALMLEYCPDDMTKEHSLFKISSLKPRSSVLKSYTNGESLSRAFWISSRIASKIPQ